MQARVRKKTYVDTRNWTLGTELPECIDKETVQMISQEHLPSTGGNFFAEHVSVFGGVHDPEIARTRES